MSLRVPLALVFLLVSASIAAGQGDPVLPTLQSVAQVRNLSLAEAARGYPLKFQATVLLNDHVEAGGTLNVVFVHDGSAGIYAGSRGPPLDLRPGEVIALEGKTAAGGFAPCLVDLRFQRAGLGQYPAAPQLTMAKALDGSEDSQWIELAGVVRSVRVVDERLHLQLAAGRDRLEVEFAGAYRQVPNSAPAVDAAVKVRGVVCPVFNNRRQLLGASLYSPGLACVKRVGSPTNDPFSAPAVSFDSLLQYTPNRPGEHRVKVQGSVSFYLPGKALFLENEGQGVLVKSEQRTALKVGDEVVAVGFPVAGVYKAVLEDSSFHRIGFDPAPPEVRSINVEEALSGNEDCLPVKMAGRLVQQSRTPTEHTLVLESRGHLFTAHLPVEQGGGHRWREDSQLEVQGICVAKGTLQDTNDEWRPEAFQLLVASAGNVIIHSEPSWWTRQRLFTAIGLILLVLIIVLLWVNALHRQVRSQTAMIQLQSRREATLEERNRIARELHDTLAQSFAGSAFTLEGVAARLRKEQHALCPQVDLVLNTVRSGLTEARRSLMNLRAASLETRDLPTALRDAAHELVKATNVRLHLKLPSPDCGLPPATENEIYRIGVEAMVNAVRHARPCNLTVEVGGTQSGFALRIADDGAGFRTDGLPADYHYGLTGMRERARQIQADLEITSTPGEGTMVQLTIPGRVSVKKCFLERFASGSSA